MGKALCERSFALHRLKPEKHKQNVDVVPPGQILADANGKGAWGPFHWHPNESFPITALRNTAELRFSKLSKLIKTFHRSTMTDERLTNLAMISIESKTAKILDTTELTKTFANLENSFS